MDELLVSGIVALIVFYAGIALVVYGVLRVLIGVFEAVVTGNYLFLLGILAGIFGAVIVYIMIGLWLRRIESSDRCGCPARETVPKMIFFRGGTHRAQADFARFTRSSASAAWLANAVRIRDCS